MIDHEQLSEPGARAALEGLLAKESQTIERQKDKRRAQLIRKREQLRSELSARRAELTRAVSKARAARERARAALQAAIREERRAEQEVAKATHPIERQIAETDSAISRLRYSGLAKAFSPIVAARKAIGIGPDWTIRRRAIAGNDAENRGEHLVVEGAAPYFAWKRKAEAIRQAEEEVEKLEESDSIEAQVKLKSIVRELELIVRS